MDLERNIYEYVDWINLVQDNFQWWDPFETVIYNFIP
jgi:hypothetical protein